VSYAFVTYLDASTEKAVVTFPMATMTAANHDAQVALVTALLAALPDVTNGTIMEHTVVERRVRDSNAVPASGQRELKWLLTYQDDTTKKLYTTELPCADDSAGLRMGGKDDADLTNAGWTDFIAAFNAMVIVDGHTCTLLRAKIVGRNT
jgi:hypothetical protein